MEEEGHSKTQSNYALIALAEKIGQQSEQVRQLQETMGSQEADRHLVADALDKLTDVVERLQTSMSRVPEAEHSDHHRFITELVKRQAAQTKFWTDLIDDVKRNSVRIVFKGVLAFVGFCILLAVSQGAVKEIVKAATKAAGLPL